MKTTETMATLAAGAPNGIQLQMKKGPSVHVRSLEDFAFWQVTQDPELGELCAIITLRAWEYSLREQLLKNKAWGSFIPLEGDNGAIYDWAEHLIKRIDLSKHSHISGIKRLIKDVHFDLALQDFAQNQTLIQKFGNFEAAKYFFARLREEKIPKVYLVFGHVELHVWDDKATNRLKKMLNIKGVQADSFRLVLKNYVLEGVYKDLEYPARLAAELALRYLLKYQQEGRYDIFITPNLKEAEYDCFYSSQVPASWVQDRNLKVSWEVENGYLVVTVEQVLS